MSIVPSNSADEKIVSRTISQFISTYGVISLLMRCGGGKEKGFSAAELFVYVLTNVFRNGSFYMQQALGKASSFSKNTYYRFLADPPHKLGPLHDAAVCAYHPRASAAFDFGKSRRLFRHR